MHPAPFVWLDETGTAPMTHGYFRREFKRSGPCQAAKLHLYADTLYHLYVNEEFVGYGPVRSYPEYPCYDTYDLAPLLGKGKNVIAVHVLHVGMDTFHHLRVRAGLCAWGEVKGGGEKVDLSTAAGWQCRPAGGYDPNMPRWSFAIGPVQNYDERLDPPGWNALQNPAGSWQPPVALQDQAGWGELLPRPIPALTQEVFLPQILRSAKWHDEDQVIHSFRLNADFDRNHAQQTRNTRGFACTYIHSPRAQQVTGQRFWGEFFLNGQAVASRPARPEQVGHSDVVLDLQEGWNFFFASYGIVMDNWEFHLGVPRSAGLELAGDKVRGSRVAFLTAGPIPNTEAEPILKHCPPRDPNAIPELASRWQPQPHREVPVSPTFGLGMARFGADLKLADTQVGDLKIPGGQDASLVFDMGQLTLGRIFVDFEAPAGTVLDVGSAEELRGDRPDYKKMPLMSPGERQIARGGVSRMETFQPRGLRYLHLSVRNHRQPVIIRKIGVVRQIYPFQKRGSFECSDPFFNTLWAYGWNTLRLCAEDLYTDCPWRERTIYAGDLLPETATTMVAAGDLRLVRHSLEVFLESHRPETPWFPGRVPSRVGGGSLSDFTLFIILIADWYCRSTRDRAFARRCTPIVRSILEHALTRRGADGVYTPQAWFFVEHRQEKTSPLTTKGRICTMNALMGAAWRAGASLLSQAGQTDEVKKMQAHARQADRVVREKFWDEKVGAFADAIQDGKLENAHHLVTNAWCLMFGQGDRKKAQRIVEHIRRTTDGYRNPNIDDMISPYSAFYLLGGLYAQGQEGAAEEITRYLYGDMIKNPTGTIWEGGDRNKSLVHAWCTAPNYYLSTRTLGVRMGMPDTTSFDEIVIAPQAESVDWARGTVTHPKGLVTVDWRISGKRLILRYQAPKGAKVTIAPEGRLAKLKLVVEKMA